MSEMKVHSRKTFKAKNTKPLLVTAKKHWIVYIIPLLFTVAGITLIGFEEITFKSSGFLLTGLSVYHILKKASVRWHLTNDHVYIETGAWPWSKSYTEIPVYDIYKSSANVHFFGKVLNIGTIKAERRVENCPGFIHYNISNPEEFTKHLNLLVKKLSAHNLNNLYELREKGMISEHEYNIIKLGYITKQYLG